MKHLNTAEITASYGVLRIRAALAIAVFMAVLVFVGGANAHLPVRPRFLRRLKSKPDQQWSFLAFCWQSAQLLFRRKARWCHGNDG